MRSEVGSSLHLPEQCGHSKRVRHNSLGWLWLTQAKPFLGALKLPGSPLFCLFLQSMRGCCSLSHGLDVSARLQHTTPPLRTTKHSATAWDGSSICAKLAFPNHSDRSDLDALRIRERKQLSRLFLPWRVMLVCVQGLPPIRRVAPLSHQDRGGSPIRSYQCRWCLLQPDTLTRRRVALERRA